MVVEVVVEVMVSCSSAVACSHTTQSRTIGLDSDTEGRKETSCVDFNFNAGVTLMKGEVGIGMLRSACLERFCAKRNCLLSK